MGRGPSYPFIDLEGAISATKKIYEFTKRATAPTDSVVEHALGYSLKSSGSGKTIAALRSFGLIEETGQTLKISDRGYRILMDHPESSDRKQAIKDAALSPKWYLTAFEKWGPVPPASTRSTLILEHGFVPTTVDGFLKDYRKTIEYAGLTERDFKTHIQSKDGSTNLSYTQKIGDYVQWESQGVLKMPAASKLKGFSPNGDFAFVEGALTGIPVAELISADPPEEEPLKALPLRPGGITMKAETFTTGDGITAEIKWPSEITAEAFDDFLYRLEGLKRAVSRAIKKEIIATGVPSSSES